VRVQRFGFTTAKLPEFALACASLFAVVGCGTDNPPMTAMPKPMLSATVMGGRKPISNSAVVLRELGTTGIGSMPKTLGNTITNAQGTFNFATINCTSPTSQLYITASGGVATSGANIRNPGIALAAMLGPCNNLPNIVILNELSTVAAAYTFAQFINPTNPLRIGAKSTPGTTQYLGATNAGATLANLIRIANGAPGPILSKTGNSPATLNTLADILVACINSLSPFTPCTNLFNAATPPGGTTPTTTLQAIYNIVTHPANNVAALYSVLSQMPSDVPTPFTPTLAVAPNDWLLSVNFTPGDLNGSRNIAIDQSGNVWIANAFGNSITELSPLGLELSPAGGYKANGTLSGPNALAFDTSGRLWVGNFFNDTVEAIDSSGNVVVNPFGTSTTYSNPNGLALDSFNQVWVANQGAGISTHQLTVTTTSGAFQFWVSGFGLGTAFAMAADTTVSPNIMWVSNTGTGGVSQIINDGTTSLTGTNVSGGEQQGQQGIAIDNNGDVWVTNTTSVTKIHNAATPTVALGPIAVGGITSTSDPYGITTDSANNVWVLNANSNSVTELDTNGNALSPSGGFTAGGKINGPFNGIAIDRSGNVWVVNAGNNTVTKFVGAAAPVATPRTSGRPIAP